MRLTKHGHACVRLENEKGVLIIDPGVITEAGVIDGADAVLITHEHFDHLEADRLRRAAADDPRLEIWTCPAVAGQLADLGGRVHAVGHGDAVQVAGFDVRVYGERHAVITPDLPVVQNVGFLVDGEVFHPGDAFTVPDVPVPTLCLPTNAPWMKVSEMVDYLREVAPQRAYSVHDGLLNDAGLQLVDGQLTRQAQRLGADVRRLALGESVSLP